MHAMRRIFQLALVTTVGVLLVAPAMAAEDVAATVTWQSARERGTTLFQGRLDGARLRGRLHAGGQSVVVDGDVAADGTVSGAVTAPDGTRLGSFSASLAGGRFVGRYVLASGGRGSWDAPAEGFSAGAR